MSKTLRRLVHGTGRTDSPPGSLNLELILTTENVLHDGEEVVAPIIKVNLLVGTDV